MIGSAEKSDEDSGARVSESLWMVCRVRAEEVGRRGREAVRGEGLKNLRARSVIVFARTCETVIRRGDNTALVSGAANEDFYSLDPFEQNM